MTQTAIGSLLQAMREKKGLSYDELNAATGIGQGNLIAMEVIGDCTALAKGLKTLADFYGVPAIDLFITAGLLELNDLQVWAACRQRPQPAGPAAIARAA